MVIYIAREVPEIECAAMAGNPRENAKGKGFWDGGGAGHGTNKESSGRPSGLPGTRKQHRTGVKTDLDFPDEDSSKPTTPQR
jgi:hypothetical protein